MRNSIRLTRSKDIRYPRLTSSKHHNSQSQELIYIDNPKIDTKKEKKEKKLYRRWNLSKKKLRMEFSKKAVEKSSGIKLEVLKKAHLMVRAKLPNNF